MVVEVDNRVIIIIIIRTIKVDEPNEYFTLKTDFSLEKKERQLFIYVADIKNNLLLKIHS